MTVNNVTPWLAEVNQLFADVVNGKKGAFHQLYEQTNAKLFGIVLRIVPESNAAADVLQEAYLKVWTHAGCFDTSKGEAWSWLCQLFRNKAIDHYRHLQRFKSALETCQPTEPYSESTRHWENTRQVSQLLDHLSPDQQRMIVSAYVNGYTHQELSELFDEPVGTVKSKIRRGLVYIKNQTKENRLSGRSTQRSLSKI